MTPTTESQQTSSSNEFEQEESQTSSEGSQEGTTQGSEGTPSQGSTNEGAQSPFTSGRLKGMTPAEVEQKLALLETTTKEQSRTLNQLHEQTNRQAPPAEETPSGRQGPSAADYWTDPVEATRRIVEEAISPFKENLAASRAQGAWQRAERELKNFSDYRPLVEAMVRQYKIDSPTFENLSAFHRMAVGHVAIEGWPEGMKPAGEERQPPTNDDPPPPPPQHSASSQPLPKEGSKPKRRQLTEAERRLAKENNMTHEEFLDWTEAPADTVIDMETK